MMRDASGALTCVVADDGSQMSFAVHNLATPFHSRAELTMNNAPSANTSSIGVEVTEQKISVRLKCRAPQGAAVDVNLTASELDALLPQLAQARAELSQQVPLELVQGTTVNTQREPGRMSIPSFLVSCSTCAIRVTAGLVSSCPTRKPKVLALGSCSTRDS
jgi:hypothetical protein